jgi:hypothetical protein
LKKEFVLSKLLKIVFLMKKSAEIGGFLYFMELFSRAFVLCRTFVPTMTKSRLLHLNDSAPSKNFKN